MAALTWKQLKIIANKVPDSRLNDSVVIWTEDENAYVVTSVEILKEDHISDTDYEGCAPRSQMIDYINDQKRKGEYFESDYSVTHKKGTRILFAE